MGLPTLYEIAADYRRITDLMMDSDADEQTIVDTLEGERWPLEVKATNYAMVIRNIGATAEAIKAAEIQMAARRKTLERRAEWLKSQLKGAMEFTGVTKIESPEFVIRVQNNPESVEIDEPALLPSEYWRQPEPPPPEPDKTAIKEALKAGEDIPGARLVRGTHLRIK